MWATSAQFLGLAISGALLAEASGYVWHRWACHAGIFRGIYKDFFRRRHFDHHMYKYNVKRLHSRIYEESCEVAFHPMGIVIILALTALVLFGIIGWQSFATIIGGALLYGIYGLGGMHALYHLDNDVVQRMWLFRWRLMWRAYVWLKDYHLIHHFTNRNFAILLPIFDMIGGSYMHPSELPELMRNRQQKRENLFPVFDARLSSSCGESLFRA